MRNLERRTVLKAGVGLSVLHSRLGTALAASAHTPSDDAISGAIQTGQLAFTADKRPRLRYWWPGGGITPAEIVNEVHAMADAGFGGFEICDVMNSEHIVLTDPALYFGSAQWNAGLVAALRTAEQRGLRADLYIGPGWPAVVAGIHPDDDAAMKELTYGLAIVQGGQVYDGGAPQPHAPPSGLHSPYTPPGVGLGIPQVAVTPRLEALHAARIVGDPSAVPLVLDQATLIELPAPAAAGVLAWQAPAGGAWALIGSWSRGTAMIAAQLMFEGYFYRLTDTPAYVVDHFGAVGAQAIIQWWERDLLSPELRRLLRSVGESFFEDSLEFVTECHWTPHMLDEFARRRGYSLTPLLPIVHGGDKPVFAFADAARGDKIRWDYAQTLSDLFLANHLAPLNDWTSIYGMRFRHQSYGAPIDAGLAAAQPGIPEGESLEFGAKTDSFRVLAAGRDLGHGTKILSSELGAEAQHAYKQTLASLAKIANSGYAAGVNQVRIHGFPYASAPTAQWPGFLPFAPMNAPINFAEAWGPRQPQWSFIDDLSGYMARVHDVLQSGTNKVDLAIYRESFDLAHDYPSAQPLAREGYSYHFVDAGLLALPAAQVRDRVIDPDGPGYKALLVVNQTSLRIDSARTFLAFLRAGLPIILVGGLPGLVRGDHDRASGDAELRHIMEEIRRNAHCRYIATLDEAPAMLQSLGLRGSTRSAEVSGIAFVRREHAGDVHTFIHNTNLHDVAGTITLAGTGSPYLLDPWSGAMRALCHYDSREAGHVAVPFSARAGEALIVILSPRVLFPFQTGARHALSATTEIVMTPTGLAARATASGPLVVTLQNGAARHALARVPNAITIDAWQLTVQDWQPEHPQGIESEAIATRKITHSFALDLLTPWQNLPGLADVSGIGVYTANVVLPEEWRAVSGARLSIGEVGAGSVRLRINGVTVRGINQISGEVDLGDRLKPGHNVIEILLATTLINRLRKTRPTVFTQSAQIYGLAGPLVLRPYIDIPLD